MMGRRAAFGKRPQMLGSAVAGITLEAVAGVTPVEIAHAAVATYLGHDRGRSDRSRAAIPADHEAGGKSQVRSRPAIEKREVGPHREAVERTPHREPAGPEHVYTVHLRMRTPAEGYGDRDLADLPLQTFAHRPRETLRIIEAGKLYAFGKNHGGRNHGARERTHSHLVDPGDEPVPARAEHPLETKHPP